jgi:cardiolipin synthase
MVIVDGERAFVGSQNVADSYFYPNELDRDPRVNFRNWQWHDNSTILEGGLVREMNRLFARRWMLSGGSAFDPEDARYAPPLERVGDAIASMVTTIPGMVRVPWKENAGRFALSLLGADRRPISVGENPVRARLLALPELAQQDLHIEHCYPSDSGLLERWAEIASRGAAVHMVVPLWYDTPVLGAECDRFFPELIAKGARLHGFDRAILHSKIVVMDGYYVATGSYNLTLRSARADLENELFIQDSGYGGAVRDRIRGDFAECVDVVPGTYARYRSRRSIPIFDAIVRFFII